MSDGAGAQQQATMNGLLLGRLLPSAPLTTLALTPHYQTVANQCPSTSMLHGTEVPNSQLYRFECSSALPAFGSVADEPRCSQAGDRWCPWSNQYQGACMPAAEFKYRCEPH